GGGDRRGERLRQQREGQQPQGEEHRGRGAAVGRGGAPDQHHHRRGQQRGDHHPGEQRDLRGDLRRLRAPRGHQQHPVPEREQHVGRCERDDGEGDGSQGGGARRRGGRGGGGGSAHRRAPLGGRTARGRAGSGRAAGGGDTPILGGPRGPRRGFRGS